MALLKLAIESGEMSQVKESAHCVLPIWSILASI